MKAKVLIAAILLVFAATMPVHAQGNGNGNGNSGQNDVGDNGNGNGSGNGNGNGNGQTDTPDEDRNARNGNGNNAGGNGAGASSEQSASGEVTVIPEEDLLAIVKAGQAVSLASLLPNVQERTGGEIIDAQLVRTERSLIYVVKVLTPEGHVGIEYYNARSGTHIEAR